MIAPPDSASLRWCFSTLGCANLTFPEICALATEFQIPGIELRGIGGRMDMPEYCAEQRLTADQMRDLCDRHHTRLIVAGSSLKLTCATEKDLAELITLSAWAETLNIPYVRVFGGGTWGTPLSEPEFKQAANIVKAWRNEKSARGWSTELLLETHDAFSGSEACIQLNQRLTQPLHLIWDTHHTWRIGGEAPADTWERIGQWVRHVQIKDSVDRPSARHPYTYVLPGDGQMPLKEVMALLKSERFNGYASLEWEKHWHPYLPPLREALARMNEWNWFLPRATKLAPTTAITTATLSP